jgi:electron transport complex protein RnfC
MLPYLTFESPLAAHERAFSGFRLRVPGGTQGVTTLPFRSPRKLIGFAVGEYPLCTTPLPIEELGMPPVLSFTAGAAGGRSCKAAVEPGAEVEPGQPLFEGPAGPSFPCPVRGKVTGMADAPDIRGGRPGVALQVEPASDVLAGVFPGLDPRNTDRDALAARIREAGILTDEVRPRPLVDLLLPESGEAPGTLVVLAVDREPGVSGALQLLRDSCRDAAHASALLGKISGSGKVRLAVPEDYAGEAGEACRPEGIEILTIPSRYPESLEPMVAARSGGNGVAVVAVETALAALDAVRHGRVRDRKVLTVIGPEGEAVGNYRVPMGTRLADILARTGLEPGPGDKIVAGGPMRGFAQYTAEAAVEPGVDALMLVRAGDVVPWSDEPCINCGNCVDACPVDLQVQLIGRYSEFGLFQQAGELEVEHCIDCGLCATVCIARRPLLQLIRLARWELQAENRGSDE